MVMPPAGGVVLFIFADFMPALFQEAPGRRGLSTGQTNGVVG